MANESGDEISEGFDSLDQPTEEIEDSPCLYIPTEILAGIAALAASHNSEQDVMPRQPPVMEFVPPSFEAETTSMMVNSVADSKSVGPNRIVYDMQFCSDEEDLPGIIARQEGDPALNTAGDPSVDQCYDNFGIAWNFFHKVFNRNSIDDNGVPLIGIVNFGFYFPNATWSLNRANMQHVLVFGNGWDNDPWNGGAATKTFSGTFGGFVGSLEVVVHEIMHGITRHHVRLLPSDQPGALDEHLSDVFAIMAEQWHKKHNVDEADWLIGEDCVNSELQQEEFKKSKRSALRSFINPGCAYDFGEDNLGFQGYAKDQQRAHWKDKFEGPEDRFGVHSNSGILNKAFYLAAKKFGGNSWDTVGQIWYNALTSQELPLSRDCSFSKWAGHTVKAAQDERFGADASKKVKEAWLEVGVKARLW